jgi:hypothetical protein
MDSCHGQFIWYELVTTDMAAAKAFYTGVVGWGAQDIAGASYTLFTTQEGRPVCGLTSLPENLVRAGYRPAWLGYVGVDDVDLAADRIAQLGGEIQVPPREFPNVSRLAVALDPQKVTIAVIKWLDGGAPKSGALNTLGSVGWHELLASDSKTAFAFYAELFGWQKEGSNSAAADAIQLFSAGGQTIGSIYTKPATAPFPFWLYCFNVSDIDAAIERIKMGGGKILDDLHEMPDSNWTLRCADSQGAIFALLGKRSAESDSAARVNWSSDWAGTSLSGKLRVTRIPSDDS